MGPREADVARIDQRIEVREVKVLRAVDLILGQRRGVRRPFQEDELEAVELDG